MKTSTTLYRKKTVFSVMKANNVKQQKLNFINYKHETHLNLSTASFKCTS